ncbi:hypothetical protein F3Y22_tig00111310pilonHSYRG00065 [Hibiscus syriacus]|uniref:Uncharacterized protein n=1 Tax=Hibiscus syriacus TaxID=106335 RepID=A0A6A2YQP3_HIBSY|nr:hypothetical protein F3Y22_tig00111310pilonHSYRG00065 [Hibiscus syriacus]
MTTFDYSTSKSLTHSSSLSFDPDPEPDFANRIRFSALLFHSPGSSNSIIESTPSPSTATTPESSDTAVLAGSSSPIDSANESSTTTVAAIDRVTNISPRRPSQTVSPSRPSLPTHSRISGDPCKKGAFADLLVSLMAVEGGGSGNDGNIAEISGDAGGLSLFALKPICEATLSLLNCFRG